MYILIFHHFLVGLATSISQCYLHAIKVLVIPIFFWVLCMQAALQWVPQYEINDWRSNNSSCKVFRTIPNHPVHPVQNHTWPKPGRFGSRNRFQGQTSKNLAKLVWHNFRLNRAIWSQIVILNASDGKSLPWLLSLLRLVYAKNRKKEKNVGRSSPNR